jgi:hypothetical protein
MKRFLAIAIAHLAGCHSFTHAGIEISAHKAKVPVSLTSGLVDDQGLVDPRRVHKVATFHWETDDCVDKESFDVSSAINEQVTRARGDAIVRLAISSRRKTDCVEAQLDGDIVRVDP